MALVNEGPNGLQLPDACWSHLQTILFPNNQPQVFWMFPKNKDVKPILRNTNLRSAAAHTWIANLTRMLPSSHVLFSLLLIHGNPMDALSCAAEAGHACLHVEPLTMWNMGGRKPRHEVPLNESWKATSLATASKSRPIRRLFLNRPPMPVASSLQLQLACPRSLPGTSAALPLRTHTAPAARGSSQLAARDQPCLPPRQAVSHHLCSWRSCPLLPAAMPRAG